MNKIKNVSYYEFLCQGIPRNDTRLYSKRMKLINECDSNTDLDRIIQFESPMRFGQSVGKKAEMDSFNLGLPETGKVH